MGFLLGYITTIVTAATISAPATANFQDRVPFSTATVMMANTVSVIASCKIFIVDEGMLFMCDAYLMAGTAIAYSIPAIAQDMSIACHIAQSGNFRCKNQANVMAMFDSIRKMVSRSMFLYCIVFVMVVGGFVVFWVFVPTRFF